MNRQIAILRTILALSATVLPAMAAFAQNTPVAKPAVNYWHLWTDRQGKSHLTQCAMSNFVLQSMNKPADPQWQDRLHGSGRVIFTIQPPHWNGAWHEDPTVQWVVPLEGAWFVEAQDGKRVEMGPGVVFLGEDQNTTPDAQGRKGHVSGNDAKPTRDQPCHVK